MWAIDELHGAFTYGIHFLLWLQYAGTEYIGKYWRAVHTVRKLNHFVDTLNLVTVLRHDAKSFQIIVLGFSQKPKSIGLMDNNSQ